MCPTQSLWLNKRPHDSRAEQKGTGKVGLSYEEPGGSPIGPRALHCSRAGLFPQPQSPLSALLLGCRCGGCLHPGLGEGAEPTFGGGRKGRNTSPPLLQVLQGHLVNKQQG